MHAHIWKPRLVPTYIFISDPWKHSNINLIKPGEVTLVSHSQEPYKIWPTCSGFLACLVRYIACLWPCLYSSGHKDVQTKEVQLHFISLVACPFLPHHIPMNMRDKPDLLWPYGKDAYNHSSSVKAVSTAMQRTDALLCVAKCQQIPVYSFCFIQRITRCDARAFISRTCSCSDYRNTGKRQCSGYTLSRSWSYRDVNSKSVFWPTSRWEHSGSFIDHWKYTKSMIIAFWILPKNFNTKQVSTVQFLKVTGPHWLRQFVISNCSCG